MHQSSCMLCECWQWRNGCANRSQKGGVGTLCAPRQCIIDYLGEVNNVPRLCLCQLDRSEVFMNDLPTGMLPKSSENRLLYQDDLFGSQIGLDGLYSFYGRNYIEL